MRKLLSTWLAVLETQTSGAMRRLRRTLARTAASRPIRRRSGSRPLDLEQLEARELLTVSFGLSHTPIYDTPALQRSSADVFKSIPAAPLGELNAGGQNGASKTSTKDYAYTVVGNANDVMVNPLSSGLALVGGGTDVDEVFRWMGAKANGGDFVVLRATGTGAYNSYIDKLVPALDSVATLVISTIAGANDSFVAQTIRHAEAIFIAGGDQADYINLWKNTAVETAIYDALARHAPIGGTSAGLDVLSDFDFSAQNGTITSTEALANPYDPRVILDSEFVNEGDYSAAESGPHSVLHYLDDLVTDSHFQQRDRMGRLITFMARIDQDGLASVPRGIGINEQTALLIEENGMARVVGNPYSKKIPEADQQRAVYLLSATTDTTKIVNQNQALTYTNVAVVKADYNPKTGIGDTFDLDDWTNAWRGTDVTTYYELSALNGELIPVAPRTAIY